MSDVRNSAVHVGETEHGKLRLRPGDVELTAVDLRRTPLMADATSSARRRLESRTAKGGMVARRYAAGDVVVKQGEPGWTAFYVLTDEDVANLGLGEGGDRPTSNETVRPTQSFDALIVQQAEDKDVVADVIIAPGESLAARPQPSLLERVVQKIYRAKHKPVTAEATVALTPSAKGTAVGTMGKGELFGEVSCFTNAPRSASIRVTTDTWMVEMVKNVLEVVLETEGFREALDTIYRRRVLQTDIAHIPILADAPDDAIAQLRDVAELVSLQPGDPVFEEGAPADSMYFVRTGTAKLFRRGDGDRVLGYASRGETLGTKAAFDDAPYELTCCAFESEHSGARGHATGVRLDLVRIPAKALRETLAVFEALDQSARAMIAERPSLAVGGSAVANLAGSLGLRHAESIMLIDLDRCTRCNDCVEACADAHDGVPRLTRSGPRFGRSLIVSTCRQCVDPTCLIGCPVSSIHRGGDGEIVIEDWCIGCGVCEQQCPYDAIGMVPHGDNKRAATCDQCRSIGDGTPLCVYACSVDAAKRVDGRTYFGPKGGS